MTSTRNISQRGHRWNAAGHVGQHFGPTREIRLASARGENLWSRDQCRLPQRQWENTPESRAVLMSPRIEKDAQNLETEALRDHRDGGNPRKNDCNSSLRTGGCTPWQVIGTSTGTLGIGRAKESGDQKKAINPLCGECNHHYAIEVGAKKWARRLIEADVECFFRRGHRRRKEINEIVKEDAKIMEIMELNQIMLTQETEERSNGNAISTQKLRACSPYAMPLAKDAGVLGSISHLIPGKGRIICGDHTEYEIGGIQNSPSLCKKIWIPRRTMPGSYAKEAAGAPDRSRGIGIGRKARLHSVEMEMVTKEQGRNTHLAPQQTAHNS
ncbi:hypothetical protein DFH09DRAFT_1075842 [Mycena vulgaris]|nr:hypothetical protein DFH09DRAFT_1075842 [Mycena vulgaris]